MRGRHRCERRHGGGRRPGGSSRSGRARKDIQMTTTAQSAAAAKLGYSRGKQLAQQIFHETMAAIDVRHAMLAKLKFEGGVLMAGEVAHPLVRPPRVVAFGKA